jgi:hypothetical protein
MIKASGGSCRTFEELYLHLNEKPKPDTRPIARGDYQKVRDFLEAHTGKWFSAADLVAAIGVTGNAASGFSRKHPELAERRYFRKGDGMQRRRFIEIKSK